MDAALELEHDPLEETQRLRALTALNILDTMPEERFDIITRLACRLFAVPISVITLLDRDRAWNKSRCGIDISEAPRALTFCTQAIKTDRTMVVEDARKDALFASNPFVKGEPYVRFYAGRPVHGADYHRVGTLCLIDYAPRRFSSTDMDSLNDLGAMVDRELFLIGSATSDALTGLANRRGFMDVASVILRVCKRREANATVITFDLDKFKSVNDTGGHAEGDRVLRWFAKLLFSHFRKSDVVSRFGGDEFAVICTYSTLPEIETSLARLRIQFDAHPILEKYPRLGWTAGLAQYDPGSDQSIEELLEACDSRLYRAKSKR